MRLDNILLICGMASQIPGARLLVNIKKIDTFFLTSWLSSRQVIAANPVTTRDEQQRSRALILNYIDSSTHEEWPKHLTLHSLQYKKGFVKKKVNG